MDPDLVRSVVDADGSVRDASLRDLLATSDRTLLYFYPKDDTPGCTLEAQDFTRLREQFGHEGIGIVGVSRDDVRSHGAFHTKCGLGIPLVCDADEALHHAFGVIGEKNNYGKIVVGVIRSTFLLDQEWKILREWRNVRATGHAEKVLQVLRKW